MRGEAAVTIPAGELRGGAQVLAAGAALRAHAARPREPGGPGAIAGAPTVDARPDLDHAPDELMPRRDRQPARRQIAGAQLQVRAAHGTSADRHEQLAL